MLSTFTWTNRGSDSFSTRYGANAELARTICDRALADWGRVIVNFNRTNGNNNFNVTINATSLGGTTRGSTSSITTDSQGKPLSAAINLDDNGGGAGWFFDPTPGTVTLPDDSEFDQFVNPFMATSSTQNGADLYRTIAHELCHAVGILIGGSPAINNFLSNTGVTDPVDGTGTLYAFNVGAGAIEATLTTTGGGHLFEGPAVPGHPELPFHPGDLINSGRSVVPPPSARQLISATDIMVLQLAYGYTVLQPADVNTFHANFNTTTGLLTVLGTSGDDGIQFSEQTGSLMVGVNSTSELIPLAAIQDVVVNAREGTDTLDLLATPPGIELRVSPSTGDDVITLSDPNNPARVMLEGPAHRLSSLFVSGDDVVRLQPGASNVLRLIGETPIAGTGRIDLSDGSMIVEYSSATPISTIESLLASGYNSGDWLGTGIGTSMGTSSQFALGYTEASDVFTNFPATFAGQSVQQNTILVRRTRYGDADLNGVVNSNDFGRLASNFGTSARRWSQGDFNYDHTTNANDFALLAGNFGQTAPSSLPAGRHAVDELFG